MLVSIIIPTYKRTTYLKKALESVLAQTYDNFECLVVNDYPPFKAEVDQLVESLEDQRIKVLHNPVNGGESVSRNNAIAVAAGEVIALLDDDDYWNPSFLEKHVEKHQENPELGVVYCGYIKFWTDDLLGSQVYPAATPSSGDIYPAMLSGKFVLASSSIVSVKKVCFQECGVFDPSLPSFADWDMWVRIARKYPFGNIPEPLTYYRHHLGERGSTDIEKRLVGIEVIARKWHAMDGFQLFERKLRVRAYFNEIRNEVLRGHRWNSFRLLKECVKKCRNEILPNARVFFKAVLIVILGKGYIKGHKILHP